MALRLMAEKYDRKHLATESREQLILYLNLYLLPCEAEETQETIFARFSDFVETQRLLRQGKCPEATVAAFDFYQARGHAIGLQLCISDLVVEADPTNAEQADEWRTAIREANLALGRLDKSDRDPWRGARPWMRAALRPLQQNPMVPYKLTVAGRELSFPQAHFNGLAALGMAVWDASVVLAKLLEKQVDNPLYSVRGKRVIELGAGCGVPGIASHFLGATEVMLTDIEDARLLDHLRLNISSNLPAEAPVRAGAYVWGESTAAIEPLGYDVVMGTDILYDEDIVQPFITALKVLVTPTTVAWVVVESHRRNAIPVFKDLVAADGFIVEDTPKEAFDPEYYLDYMAVMRLTRPAPPVAQ